MITSIATELYEPIEEFRVENPPVPRVAKE
jgi:hypothetical protein